MSRRKTCEPVTRSLQLKGRIAHFANHATRIRAERRGITAAQLVKIEPKRVNVVPVHQGADASLLRYLRHQNWLDQTGRRERKKP